MMSNQASPPNSDLSPRLEALLMGVREGVIAILNALDDYLGRERTIERRVRDRR